MKKSEQDIQKTLAQLHIYPVEAKQIADDIRAGDELLERHDNAVMDPALLERMGQTVRIELAQEHTKGRWARRIIVAAAVVLVAIGTAEWVAHNGPHAEPTIPQIIQVAQQEGDPFESEANMWELSLGQVDDAAVQIDELPLTELALWLDELETESTDDTLGKEVAWPLILA